MVSPIEAVTRPDPYPYYATLVAQRPLYHDEALGMWVASDAASVTAALGEPGLQVRPPAEPVPRGIAGTPAGEVFGDLVRMTDGAAQQRLKRAVIGALGQADVATVAALAVDRAARTLKGSDALPLAELMFAVPAQTVAALCGLDDRDASEASRLIGDFVRCIPTGATPEDQAAAARAAGALRELLGPLLDGTGSGLLAELVRAAGREDWHETAPLLANGIGLLSQTYDATAGLIGNTLVALTRGYAPVSGTPEEFTGFVREVARHDAPIQNTRRFAAKPVRLGEAQLEPGQAVLVVLAAANRDPAANPDPDAFRTDRTAPALFTFGAAAHRCPGETVAVAIAVGVVGALLSHGFQPADLPSPISYRPLANARIPVL